VEHIDLAEAVLQPGQGAGRPGEYPDLVACRDTGPGDAAAEEAAPPMMRMFMGLFICWFDLWVY